MIQPTRLDSALALAQQRWASPHPQFTSGHDPRTSDAALIALIHGGLQHAAGHDWLNAGRRLIDKTYIDMLWHVQSLTAMRACRPETIAANLDNFIRDHIRPVWPDLAEPDDAAKATLIVRWVDELARHCFGSLHSEAAASRLLFYLCPALPVFNLSRGHLLALEHLGYRAAGDGYADYAAAAGACLADFVATVAPLPQPTAQHIDADSQALVERVIKSTDWWQRRVFDAYLVQTADPDASQPDLFACDAAGALTAR